MTTIDQGSTANIAAASEDGTVHIYNSVTGVLRLSFRPESPVLEMTGPPDGSLLICTHVGRPSMMLWDVRADGLVKTLTLTTQAKGATISLKGRYLACEYRQSLGNGEQNTTSRCIGNFLEQQPLLAGA